MKKKILTLFIAICLALMPAAVLADTGVDLIAGQNIDVGSVDVSNDGTNLYVTYTTVDDWYLAETHLHVASSVAEIPQKNGNPPPGKFAYKATHDPMVQTYTYTVPLTGAETVYIAAHAEVVQQEITAAPYYPCLVVDFWQGQTKGGGDVRPARSDPANGLYFETGQNEANFYSLGFGGFAVMEFCCPVVNGDGPDIRVIEDTWGSYPVETADVYASQDGISWVYLGSADNTTRYLGIHTITDLDLGVLEWAKYISVTDTSNPAVHNNSADGYDLNAVEALHDCVNIVGEETAWGDGIGFPGGKNWAMYFTYTID